jgi:hypothetical protein
LVNGSSCAWLAAQDLSLAEFDRPAMERWLKSLVDRGLEDDAGAFDKWCPTLALLVSSPGQRTEHATEG